MRNLALRGVAAVLALLLVVATFGLRRSARARAPAPVDMVLDVPAVPGDVARPLAFGFRSLLADLTFLEAIQVLATRRVDLPAQETVPIDRRLQNLIAYSVDVDPKFPGAYRFIGAALPHETIDGKVMGVLGAVSILEQGVRERPDDWHIPFMLGFLQGYYLQDFASASKSLAVASRAEGAPRYLPFLATRLGAQGGDLNTATALAETMLAQANEEATRRMWQERVDALRMERDLRAIEAAAARYRVERGVAPASVRALAAGGYLREEPVEPHGGRYLLAPDGTASSTGGERLRVFGKTGGLEVH